jgi:hypothetical protein
MTTPAKDPAIIKLPNVRLSFPHLFKPHAMEEGQEPKFSATFLLDVEEHGKLLDHIDATIDRLALDEFKKKISFKRCLRDGNEKLELEGYGDGKFFIPASRKTRPAVVDGQLNPIAEEDGKIYAGCYVNATIRLWVQNNKWGKRVNAELRAVQFLKDGESFGAGVVNVEDEFEPVTEGGDEAPASRRSSRGKTSTDPNDF